MIILGIDPGLRNTGFGVIKSERNLIAYISSGIVTTTNNDTLAERLKDIFIGVREIIAKYTPEYAVMEKVFGRYFLILNQYELRLTHNRLPKYDL